MPQQNKKTFNITKIQLSEVQDENARFELEMKFTDYRVQQQASVEAQRLALVSDLKAKSQEAAAQIALTEFLMLAGTHFDEVKTEPIWFAYRSNGEIVLESPFTERDMRNGVRLQRAQMNAAAADLTEKNGNTDMYEKDDE